MTRRLLKLVTFGTVKLLIEYSADTDYFLLLLYWNYCYFPHNSVRISRELKYYIKIGQDLKHSPATTKISIGHCTPFISKLINIDTQKKKNIVVMIYW
jgi:hypothetical protein